MLEPLAQRQHQLLAVVGEFEDLLHHVVDHPDVLFRIVGTDLDVVRAAAALEEVIPLRPVLQQLAVAVDHQNAVLQARLALRGRLPEGAVASRVAFGRFLGNGKFAAVERCKCDWGSRRKRRPAIPRSIRDGPAAAASHRDFVRAGLIFAALLRRALRLLRLCGRSAEKYVQPVEQCQAENCACEYEQNVPRNAIPLFHFVASG